MDKRSSLMDIGYGHGWNNALETSAKPLQAEALGDVSLSIRARKEMKDAVEKFKRSRRYING